MCTPSFDEGVLENHHCAPHDRHWCTMIHCPLCSFSTSTSTRPRPRYAFSPQSPPQKTGYSNSATRTTSDKAPTTRHTKRNIWDDEVEFLFLAALHWQHSNDTMEVQRCVVSLAHAYHELAHPQNASDNIVMIHVTQKLKSNPPPAGTTLGPLVSLRSKRISANQRPRRPTPWAPGPDRERGSLTKRVDFLSLLSHQIPPPRKQEDLV